MPDTEATAISHNREGDSIAKLETSQLAGLHERRRTVYGQRESIWQQVSTGLMPPKGKFLGFQKLSSIFTSPEADACTKDKAYASMSTSPSREVLRSWLACGAPIVESNSAVVDRPRVVGVEGYQYPSCEPRASSEPEEPSLVSLETLLEGSLSTCSACHPFLSEPDFSSADAVRTSLIELPDVICNDKPYLTKGSSDQSFLYDILAFDDPGCGTKRMPSGGPYLGDADLALIAKWIAAGAPVTQDEVDALGSNVDDATASESTDPAAQDAADAGELTAGELDGGQPSGD